MPTATGTVLLPESPSEIAPTAKGVLAKSPSESAWEVEVTRSLETELSPPKGEAASVSPAMRYGLSAGARLPHTCGAARVLYKRVHTGPRARHHPTHSELHLSYFCMARGSGIVDDNQVRASSASLASSTVMNQARNHVGRHIAC